MTTPKQDAESGLGWRPHLIRSALIEILQVFFESADTLARDPVIQDYTWSSNDEASKIAIEPSGKRTLQETNFEAKIVIPTAPAKFIAGPMQNGLYDKSADGNTEYRSIGMEVTFPILCLGQGEEFSWLLAAEVALQIKENALAFADHYDWKALDVEGIQPVDADKIDDDSYGYTVPVMVRVAHGSEVDLTGLPSALGDDYDV